MNEQASQHTSHGSLHPSLAQICSAPGQHLPTSVSCASKKVLMGAQTLMLLCRNSLFFFLTKNVTGSPLEAHEATARSVRA